MADAHLPFVPAGEMLENIAAETGALLRESGATVAIGESSSGGLIAASLLAVHGASAYFLGGTVTYAPSTIGAWLDGRPGESNGLRGASREKALYLAGRSRASTGAVWGLGESGAAGPANRLGDPAGHSWVAVTGPVRATRHVLTGNDDRIENMVAFAVAALQLLHETLIVRDLG